MRTIIYDSKGLEHGQYQDFIESTVSFFEDHRAGTDGQSDNAIHVVWYIVNAAHARFEPFERELCIKLFSNIPIFFLLNKADISTQEDRDNLRQVIKDMDLPNCCGVLDIIAESCAKLKCYEVCPMCNSDDVTEKRKSAIMLCGECGHKESLLMDHGLDAVVKSTLLVLPDVVRDNFVAAQNVSFRVKEETSHQVIGEFWEGFSGSRSYKVLLSSITRMLARLSLVWEFAGHSIEIGTLLASDLVTSLKWTRKAKLWQRKKLAPSEAQRMHVTSLGILWNLCLRGLARKLVSTWASELQTPSCSHSNDWNGKCSVLFNDVFSAMNEQNLKKIENELLLGGTFVDVLQHSVCLNIF